MRGTRKKTDFQFEIDEESNIVIDAVDSRTSQWGAEIYDRRCYPSVALVGKKFSKTHIA